MRLPIRAELTFRPWSLAIATAYGSLVALLFTLWPLGRAEQVRAGVLFRDEVAPERALPRRGIIVATVAVGAALLALAAGTSESQRLALYFCLGLAAIFAVFLGLGTLLTWAAQRAPRPRRPELAPRSRKSWRAGWADPRPLCCRSAQACRCWSPSRSSDASIVDELDEPPAQELAELLRARSAVR